MTDSQFLNWVADRLVHVYGESPNTDFVLKLRSMASASPDPNGDDIAVDMFAKAMKEKLAQARTKGRSGWQTCNKYELSNMLREHVDKGDPRDVANFCMFLHALGHPIQCAPKAPSASPAALTDELDLIVSVLTGYPKSMARADALRAVDSIRRLLAASPAALTDDALIAVIEKHFDHDHPDGQRLLALARDLAAGS